MSTITSIIDSIFGPPLPPAAERRAMLEQFPALQRRNRTLFNEWAAIMNRIEAGERFGNPQTPSYASQMAVVLDHAQQGEAQMVAMIRTAIENGVRAGVLPATSLRDAGLGAGPLVILVPVLVAFLVAVLLPAYWLIHRTTLEDQARAEWFKQAALRGDPLPEPAPGPIERTVQAGFGVAGLAAAAGILYLLTQRSRR